jgi:hypothetical protein
MIIYSPEITKSIDDVRNELRKVEEHIETIEWVIDDNIAEEHNDPIGKYVISNLEYINTLLDVVFEPDMMARKIRHEHIGG